MSRLNSNLPPKRKSLAPKKTDRVAVRELSRGDEIMVATGGFSPIARLTLRKGKTLIETNTGEKTLMDDDTVVGVRR